jgi:hypothetical protein
MQVVDAEKVRGSGYIARPIQQHVTTLRLRPSDAGAVEGNDANTQFEGLLFEHQRFEAGRTVPMEVKDGRTGRYADLQIRKCATVRKPHERIGLRR